MIVERIQNRIGPKNLILISLASVKKKKKKMQKEMVVDPPEEK